MVEYGEDIHRMKFSVDTHVESEEERRKISAGIRQAINNVMEPYDKEYIKQQAQRTREKQEYFTHVFLERSQIIRGWLNACQDPEEMQVVIQFLKDKFPQSSVKRPMEHSQDAHGYYTGYCKTELEVPKVTFVAERDQHDWVTHENCKAKYCVVCHGGHRICRRCMLSGDAITTHCPKGLVSENMRRDIRNKKADYFNGKWNVIPGF
jgi:hypothetical protein